MSLKIHFLGLFVPMKVSLIPWECLPWQSAPITMRVLPWECYHESASPICFLDMPKMNEEMRFGNQHTTSNTHEPFHIFSWRGSGPCSGVSSSTSVVTTFFTLSPAFLSKWFRWRAKSIKFFDQLKTPCVAQKWPTCAQGLPCAPGKAACLWHQFFKERRTPRQVSTSSL